MLAVGAEPPRLVPPLQLPRAEARSVREHGCSSIKGKAKGVNKISKGPDKGSYKGTKRGTDPETQERCIISINAWAGSACIVAATGICRILPIQVGAKGRRLDTTPARTRKGEEVGIETTKGLRQTRKLETGGGMAEWGGM